MPGNNLYKETRGAVQDWLGNLEIFVSVERVKAEFDAPKRIGGAGELGWFAWFFDQGAMPGGAEMRQIELFAEHIIPAFRRRARQTRHTRVKIEAHPARQDEGVRVSPGASGLSPANSLPAPQAIP